MEPVDCQEHRQHTIERRSQTRRQQWNQWTVNRGTAEVSMSRRNDVSMCRTGRKCTHGDAPEKQGRRACDAARRKRADGGVVPSVRMGPCSSVRMDPHSSSE